MPWKKIGPMDQKIRLISDWKDRYLNITDLSKKYEVSRKTIYKWIDRYETEGIDGLKDQERIPNNHPNQTDKRIVNKLIKMKYQYRKWGPKKIIALLENKYPNKKWPVVSTVGTWFKKYGLVQQRKFRRKVAPYEEPFLECRNPNDIWSADYKGQFRTQDNRVCYPLTISDNKSRYLLECEALRGPRYDESRTVFERIFRENGLPLAIRVDNGIPFAGTGIAGLSRMSVWWIKLGIRPERIEKGKPQQNGRHERMHRTLKEDIKMELGKNLKDQQNKFDWFRMEYNEIRPHEAIGQKPPAQIYEKSKRPYVKKPVIPEYDLKYEVRKVKDSGEIKFKGRFYYLSALLGKEQIGLQEIADGAWCIYFSFMPLGILNLRHNKIETLEKGKSVTHVPGLKCNLCST